MNQDLSQLHLEDPHDFSSSLIDEQGKLRVKVSADPRIETIAATWRQDMTLFQKIKAAILKNVVYVAVKDQSTGEIKQLAININSFSKRFKLSSEEARRVLENPETFSRFSSLIDDLARSISRDMKEIAGDVQSIVKKVLFQIKPYVSFNWNNLLDFRDEKFRVVRNEYGLSVLKLGEQLGNGSFGEVFEVQDLLSETEPTDEVLKIAKKSEDKSIENEYQVLLKLNPDGHATGIQRPPRKIISLGARATTNLPGYLAPRYEGPLSDHAEKMQNKRRATSAIYQLASGLIYMGQQGWLHGDIKPENMLLGARPERYDLADLGGARTYGDIVTSFIKYLEQSSLPNESLVFCQEAAIDEILRCYTKDYTDPDTVRSLREMFSQFAEKLKTSSDPQSQAQIKQAISQALVLFLQARDVYSLGVSLSELLKLDYRGYPKQLDPRLQSDVADCLERMKAGASDHATPEACYRERLDALQRLRELCQPSPSPDSPSSTSSTTSPSPTTEKEALHHFDLTDESND